MNSGSAPQTTMSSTTMPTRSWPMVSCLSSAWAMATLVPTPSVERGEQRAAVVLDQRRASKSPANPPRPPSTSGPCVRATAAFISSTARSPASTSTPAAAYVRGSTRGELNERQPPPARRAGPGRSQRPGVSSSPSTPRAGTRAGARSPSTRYPTTAGHDRLDGEGDRRDHGDAAALQGGGVAGERDHAVERERPEQRLAGQRPPRRRRLQGAGGDADAGEAEPRARREQGGRAGPPGARAPGRRRPATSDGQREQRSTARPATAAAPPSASALTASSTRPTPEHAERQPSRRRSRRARASARRRAR